MAGSDGDVDGDARGRLVGILRRANLGEAEIERASVAGFPRY